MQLRKEFDPIVLCMLSAVTVGRSGVDKLETAQGEQHFHALLFSSRLKLGKSLGLIIMFFKLFLCGLFLHGRAHYHDFGCGVSILGVQNQCYISQIL